MDQTTIQWLNLLNGSPTFVVRVGSESEKAALKSLGTVPSDDGEYWVAGTTKLKCGIELESVFRVDTDTGGTLIGVYWRISDRWWDFRDRPRVFDALGVDESEVFPFDWSYAVALEGDLFGN